MILPLEKDIKTQGGILIIKGVVTKSLWLLILFLLLALFLLIDLERIL